MPRSPRSRLLLLSASLLVGLAAAEVGWRLLRTAGYGPTTNPRLTQHDARLGWRFRPEASVRHETDDFSVTVTTNRRGFRGGEFPRPDPARPLAVALGDSLTFGWGVEEHQAFPARLADLLGVPVLNLAVSGYGTDQELLLWESDGRPLQPALVVLTLCANDAREVWRGAMYGRRKPWFERLEGELHLRGVPVPRDRLGERLAIVGAFNRWRLKRAHPALAESERAPARALRDALLDRLAETVVADGAALLIVHEGLELALPARDGVTILDVAPVLAAGATEEPVVFAADPHWNARGHECVAQALARVIEEGRLLR